MKLQTIVPLQKAEQPIDYSSKMLLLGSCFVENMGERLDYYKFRSLQNPFGILFHPLALENLVARALAGKTYQEDEVFEQNGIWHCFDAHSDLNALSREDLHKHLNQRVQETKAELENTTHMIITLGTAWVYENIASRKVVANCHKVPQKEFVKKLLTPEEIRSSLGRLVHLVEKVNPKTNIIFTVSPVRHLKDGFVENQQSKAHLITSLHSVLSSRAQSRDVSYFPAYEIMMDELRDYRFYGKDLVHPNELAVEYIWEKFKDTWISPDCYSVMDEVDSVQKGLQHRPFNPDSEAHQTFRKSLRTKITYLQERYPFMKFE